MNNHYSISSSFYEESSSEHNPSAQAHFLLAKMQQLHFDSPPKTLIEEVHHLMADHLNLLGVIPEAKTEVGKILISDGQFHVLWGRVLVSRGMEEHFANYYQVVYPKIKLNHTHFEHTFNSVGSSGDSSTQLVKRKRIICKVVPQPKSSKEVSLKSDLFHSKQNQIEMRKVRLIPGEAGRLHLVGLVQTNRRRVLTQCAIYLLGVKELFQLETIDPIRIQEWFEGEGRAWLVMEVWAGLETATVVGIQGDLNLASLLRAKKTYKIKGILVWQELVKVSLWVKNSGLWSS